MKYIRRLHNEKQFLLREEQYMGNLYESKAMQKVRQIGEKFAGNKAIASVSAGMMVAMGIILIGAVAQLVAIIPTFFKLYTTEDTVYKTLMVPYDLSMGLISVYMAFTIAYSYAKSLKMQAVTNALNAMLVFLIVAAPIKTVELADGSTFTGIDNSCLGAVGMFTAILISLCTVKLAHFCEKRHLMIRMPDAVPKFLQDTFASLIPLIINIIIWHTIGSLCTGVMTISLPYALSYLLSAPLGALTSVPGIIIVVFFANLLWTFGIHGTMVVYIAIMPALMEYIATNGALMSEGKALLFVPVALFGIMNCCGGTGNTLALCVMGLFSKSEQIKAVSRAAVVPGIFNINEPATFGYPIMYNPVLAIPFIFNPLITMFLCYFGYLAGLFKPSFTMITATLPVGVSPYLCTLSWTNILIPVIAFAVAWLVYWPFFKVYEKQLMEKEAANVEGA